MTIEELRRRIITNTLLAVMSSPNEAHKLCCDVVIDSARLCIKKIEQFVKQGATKEEYNGIAAAWRASVESAQKIVKATPRDNACRTATNLMVVRLTLLAEDLKGLPEQIPFTDAPPIKEKSEQEIKQEEIDRILDKISSQGINSLTQQEKDILANFSKS